jgi:hypothetical protein
MLELLSPNLLFNKQRVFHLNDSVNKTGSSLSACRAVVIYDQPAETLPAGMKEMLDKLVQACQFKPEETVYLNARFVPDISLGDLQNEYKPEAVLVFGEVSISRNISKMKKNFPYELNGVKIINTDNIDTLLKNGEAKKVLWGVLKRMLSI